MMALEGLPVTGTWRQFAACRGVDPEVFHPTEEEDPSRAQAICAECPVQEVCLEHALAVREKHGVWGGLTERERRRVLRQRRRSA
jgi:WhiB family redox-sensing transcriptional regulator